MNSSIGRYSSGVPPHFFAADWAWNQEFMRLSGPSSF